MKTRFSYITVILIFFSLVSKSQVTISPNGATDVCNTSVVLEVDNPQPGWNYNWHYFTNTCSGIIPVQVGPAATGTSFSADFTAKYFCVATDLSGSTYTSNSINIRNLPGSLFSSELPAPYPNDTAFCQLSVSLCVPSDFYDFFPTSISWFMNNNLIAGAQGPAYTATLQGWYKYSITSSCITDFSDSIFLLNPPQVPVIVGTTTICSGQSTILSVVGSYATYLWSTGAATQAINVLSAGTYTVIVSNFPGCTATASITVTVSPNPTPTITGDNSICQGLSTIFTASPGYSAYLWSNGALTQSIVVNIAGTYTVTVTDVNGCFGTSTRVLTVNPNPVTIITGDSTLCLPQTSGLNGGAGFVSYLWNTLSTTQSIVVSSQGTYTVSVTNANGCAGSDTIQVTGPFATISGNNSVCNGSSTDLTIQFTGSSPYSYSYHDGVNVYGPYSTTSNPEIITVNPVVTTNYFLVSYSDAFCQGAVGGNALIDTGPIPVITGDSTLCPGQITTLDAGPGYSAYFWSTGDVAQTTNVGGIGIYSVTVVDANGCSGTGSITISNQLPYPTILTAAGPLGICQGDSVHLFAQFPLDSYQWYKNNIIINGATGASLWASTAGRYQCLTVDSSGCSGTSNFAKVSIVCFPPLPPVDRLEQLNNEETTVVIFPNPSREEFTIRFNREMNEAVELKIRDITGKEILHQSFFISNDELKLSELKSGYYLLEIKTDKGMRLQKSLMLL